MGDIMCPRNPSIEAILKKANGREERFQWLEAAQLYEKALQTGAQSASLTTEIMEKLGFSYVRASRQAEDLKTFKKFSELAVKTYSNAAELVEREKSIENEGRNHQLKAIAEYVNSWLANDPSQKMRMLKTCDAFSEKALDAYKKGENGFQFGRAYNILSLCTLEQIFIASDVEEKQTLVQERIKSSDEIISVLSRIEEKKDLLLAYSLVSLQCWYAANISDKEDERKKLARKSLITSEKAIKLSEQVHDPYYVAMSRWAATLSTLFFAENIESSLKYANEMLQQGTAQNDHYIKGIAYYLLAFVTNFMRWKEVDSEKKKKTHKNAINYAEKAIHNLQLTAQDYYIAETYRLYIESQSSLANDEIDIDTKRALLEKATSNGQKGLEHATRSGSPDATASILHALSKTLHTHSNFESEKANKRRLLKNALLHRKNYIKIAEKAFPSNEWVLGVGKYYAGLIEAELSQLETNQNSKIALFSNAVADMADGISYCQKWVSSRPSPSYIAFAAEFEDTFGRILYESYILTGEKTNLTRAIEVYNEAIEKFKIINMPSRVAESFWKIARDKDLLGEYLDASESFEEAYKQYMVAAQKIHQFADFYQDYASYMKAWSEIERARDYHAKKRYEQAKEKYEKAARIIESIERWNHLSLNYFALAKLEEAENLSRYEQADKARKLFQQAITLFDEARESITVNVKKIQDANQEKITIELDGIINSRKEYCFGRIALEEAKILDRQGDYSSSAKKFGEAVKIFREMSEKSSKEEHPELQSIIFLCRAWERMMMAEAKTSPIMYKEAAELFEQAKEYIPDQQTGLLALANSNFCKALEAGTKFEATREQSLYTTAKKFMEAASNSYLMAGFSTASEYAVATQRLFDGYIYMENGNKEADPEKQARYYAIAEKVLKSSTELYKKSKHIEKAKQVQKLLEKVQEEHTLATSLSEILHAPTIASSTTGFITPASSNEKAVGLNEFEHTSIQSHLTIPEEVVMEEDFEIQLDLVNVAKSPGLLVRIANFIPRELKVSEAPSNFTIENGSIELRGKRFEPLKVETFKIIAQARDFGVFKVNPQVIYLDNTGQFKTSQTKVVFLKVQPPTRKPGRDPRLGKYKLIYKNLLDEYPRTPKNECRVAIAQIGVSQSGDILSEFYEEKGKGLFGLRLDKVEAVRCNVRNSIEKAHEKNVDILLFPELTIDFNYNQLLEEVINLSKKYNMYIIPGSYHDQKTKLNVSVVVGPDGILWRQEKHIPAIIHLEGKRFTEGIEVKKTRKTIVCNTEFGRIAIAICRDFLDMDLRVEMKNFDPPIDLVFNPAFTPVTADFRAAHFDARRSIYTYCFFANVAEFGDSFIYTPEKERVERTIAPKEENIIYKDIDLFSLRSERKKWEKEKKRFIQSTK